jgi:hypothetical protein
MKRLAVRDEAPKEKRQQRYRRGCGWRSGAAVDLALGWLQIRSPNRGWCFLEWRGERQGDPCVRRAGWRDGACWRGRFFALAVRGLQSAVFSRYSSCLRRNVMQITFGCDSNHNREPRSSARDLFREREVRALKKNQHWPFREVPVRSGWQRIARGERKRAVPGRAEAH